MPEPIAVLPPPVLPALPVVPSVEPSKPVAVDVPSPLPISMTEESRPEEPKRVEVKVEAPKRENQNWQPTTEPAQPRPGTWAPSGEQPTPLPTRPAEGAWKSGDATVKPVVARAQMPDNNSDPIADLIRQVCKGRAEGVDIRPAGPKKLMVCFETHSATEAQKLVTDISRRPELGPFQIDFCVVVK